MNLHPDDHLDIEADAAAASTGKPDSRHYTATLSPAEIAAAPKSLRTVPGYELLAELGRGGMGVVYKAKHVPLRRVVALKMILAGDYASLEDVDRFRTEAEAVARLQHPNIVQIYDIGAHDGLPYFSLEYCDGGSLAKKLAAAPLAPRQAAELIETLARAIYAAHQENIVHRDLKPSNVLLTKDGVPKIGDFGLAKKLDDAAGPTQSGAVLGTPSYMAPEQASGKIADIGPAADIYALGAMLYEMLTGRPPFRADSSWDTVQQVVNDEPAPPRRLAPKTPRDLESICLKCLEKDPRQRYPTARALARDLERFLNSEPTVARPVGGMARIGRWCRRSPWKAGLAAALACLILVGLGGGAWIGRLWYIRHQERLAREGQIQLALDEVKRSLGDKDWGKARVTLQNASALAAGNISAELKDQVASLDRTVRVVKGLEDVRTQRCNMPNCIFNYAKAPPSGPFHDFGIDVLTLEPGEAARRIRASGLAEEFIGALDDWSWNLRENEPAKKDELARLIAIAQAADDDAVRRQLRAALPGPDDGLKDLALKLVPRVQAEKLPISTVVMLADVLSKVGVIDQAATLLEEAERQHRNDFWLNMKLGDCYMDQQDWNKAIARYMVGRKHGNYVAANNLAVAHTHLKQYPEALAFLQELKSDQPHEPRWLHQLGILFNDRARHTNSLDDVKSAVVMYEAALEKDADYYPSLLNLSNCHAMLGDHAKARAALERATATSQKLLQNSPENDALRANHALTLLLLGSASWDANKDLQAVPQLGEAVALAFGAANRHPHQHAFQRTADACAEELGRMLPGVPRDSSAKLPLRAAREWLEKVPAPRPATVRFCLRFIEERLAARQEK